MEFIQWFILIYFWICLIRLDYAFRWESEVISFYLGRLGTAATLLGYCQLPRYVLRTESYNLIIAFDFMLRCRYLYYIVLLYYLILKLFLTRSCRRYCDKYSSCDGSTENATTKQNERGSFRQPCRFKTKFEWALKGNCHGKLLWMFFRMVARSRVNCSKAMY